VVDGLSDVLSSVRLESTRIATYHMTEPWGFQHPGNIPLASFFAIIKGSCWLLKTGVPPVFLQGGDFLVFPRPTTYSLASSPDAAITPLTDILINNGYTVWSPHEKDIGPCQMKYGGGGETTTLVGSVYEFAEPRNPLVAVLPEMFILRDGEGGVGRWTASILDFILNEAVLLQPGYIAIARQLSILLFLHALRGHIQTSPKDTSGWLRGLSDAHIGKVLANIHRAPQAFWTLRSLAREAGMSRSKFAARFKELVGQSPIEYLTDWRLHLAATRLTDARITIAAVARGVGYKSERVFSNAFKKSLGMAPGRYRKLKTKATGSI
jgi:AraC-like DNA-binding protein